MKKIIFVLIALCFVTSLALAQDATQPTATTTATATTTTTTVATTTDALVLKGDVQGNADSGYSISVDGKLYKFDAASNAKVAEFFKNADSKLQVSVTAKQVGDELSLVSIENQK